MLLLVVCTGFVASVPMSANALDSQVVSQNPHGEANPLIAQYRRNHHRDRQFTVYYRNRNDRQWTFEGYHANRPDAQRAANRLERRGYRTYVQVSRRVNSGMNRG
jgi:septal ring-binding cell division protein DamX